MKRLFFALWPEQPVRRQCGEVIARLDHGELRPVAARNLHVTLLFLGGVNPEQEAGLISAASHLQLPKLTVTFDKITFWKKPAVLCLTASCFADEFNQVFRLLAELAGQNRIKVEDRPFQPHVTLARKVRRSQSLEIEPIIWPAAEFCLVESVSTVMGSEYRVLQSWSCV